MFKSHGIFICILITIFHIVKMVLIYKSLVSCIINEKTRNHVLKCKIKEANLPFIMVTRQAIYNVFICILFHLFTQMLVIVHYGFTNALIHVEFIQECFIVQLFFYYLLIFFAYLNPVIVFNSLFSPCVNLFVLNLIFTHI